MVTLLNPRWIKSVLAFCTIFSFIAIWRKTTTGNFKNLISFQSLLGKNLGRFILIIFVKNIRCDYILPNSLS
jgi:hypothetical protein